MGRYLAIVKTQKGGPVVKDATKELTNPKTATPLVIMAAITNLITVGSYEKLVSNCKWNER